MRQAIFWDLGWALIAPRSGDWMRTMRFETLFPHWRETYTLAQMEAAKQPGDAYLAANHHLSTVAEEADQYTHWYTLYGEQLPALGMTAKKARALAEDRTYELLNNYMLLPEAKETLLALRSMGYRLGVISDTWPTVTAQLTTLGIWDCFDTLTFSYELGAYKPAPALYADALRKVALPAAQCTFIDDRPWNLMGARQAGIHGIQSLAEPGVVPDGRFPAIHGPGELLPLLTQQAHPSDWAVCAEPLTPADLPAMMALQAEMAAALPSPRWYVTSTEAEFLRDVQAGQVTGIYMQGELAAFASLAEGGGAHSYASILGRKETRTLDFRDVMVSPRFRRRGIHSFFLRMAEERARALGAQAMYATVDPENLPSRSSFEKAGWQALETRAAYDGRLRVFYRKGL